MKSLERELSETKKELALAKESNKQLLEIIQNQNRNVRYELVLSKQFFFFSQFNSLVTEVYF
jgi:hypothetical protein